MTCYRIRMKYGKDGKDFSKDIWQAGLVGIWFGSWDIQDLYDSYEAYRPKTNGEVSNIEIATYINKVLRDRGLPENMDSGFVSTVKAFDESLKKSTWVCTYFDGQLHLGQIADKKPHDEPRFNHEKEHFKARRVNNRKSFDVAKLPDAFRLLASAGRQTLHTLKSNSKLATILVKAANEGDVLAAVRKLLLQDWVEALGPKGWESICTAYLILEHGFLPTGLIIGGTLADFDIVGHDLQGIPIYGQCKKDPGEYKFSSKDEACFAQLPKGAKKFFFPFSGPDECSLPEVSVISFSTLKKWLGNTENGKRYANVLRG